MITLFDNENKRFRLDLTNKAGEIVLDPLLVQDIEVVMKHAISDETWLHYKYPLEESFPEVKLLDSKFYIEITTAQSAMAKSGIIDIMINYHLTDETYSEGFNSFTKIGRILKVQKV